MGSIEGVQHGLVYTVGLATSLKVKGKERMVTKTLKRQLWR
jgi:hypothetical protein